MRAANRGYGYFPPPPAGNDTLLYVGRELGVLPADFADVRTIGGIDDDMHAYCLTGQRRSWEAIWPQ